MVGEPSGNAEAKKQATGQARPYVAIERASVECNRGALLTSGKKIAGTAANFKPETSVGLGLWAIKDFFQCMPEDLHKLAELLMEWDQAVTAPAQRLVILMAMMPKKKRDTERWQQWPVGTEYAPA